MLDALGHLASKHSHASKRPSYNLDGVYGAKQIYETSKIAAGTEQGRIREISAVRSKSKASNGPIKRA